MEDRRRGTKLERSISTASGWNRLQQQVAADVAGLVDLPGGERCLWMQKMIKDLWPYITVAAAEMIQQEIQPLIDAQKPSFLTKLGFSGFDLGTAAPLITSVGISDVSTPGSPGISIDVGIMMRTAGSDIAFDVEIENPLETVGWTWAAGMMHTFNPLRKSGTPAGGPSVRFGVQVEDVEFSGVLRLALRPLMPKLPVVQAVTVSLVDTPHLDFSVRARGVDVLDVCVKPYAQAAIDFVHDYLISTILGQLENTMVWPHGVIEPLVYDSRRADIMRRAQHACAGNTCVGVLKVRVIGVRGLSPQMIQQAAASVVQNARATARAAGVSVGMGVGVGGVGVGVGKAGIYTHTGPGLFAHDLSPAKAATDGEKAAVPVASGLRGMRGAAVADLLTGDCTLITELIGAVGKPAVCPLRPGAMGGTSAGFLPGVAWQHWLGTLPPPKPLLSTSSATGGTISSTIASTIASASSKAAAKAATKAANMANNTIPPSPMRPNLSPQLQHSSQVQALQRTLAASDQRMQMNKHLAQLKRMQQLKEKWDDTAGAAGANPNLPVGELRRRRSEPWQGVHGQQVDLQKLALGAGGAAHDGRLGGDVVGGGIMADGTMGAEAGGEGAWERMERQHAQNSMYHSFPQQQQQQQQQQQRLRQQQRQEGRRSEHTHGRSKRDREDQMHLALDALASGLKVNFRVGMGKSDTQIARARVKAQRAAGQGVGGADGDGDAGGAGVSVGAASVEGGNRGGLLERLQTNRLSAAEIMLLPSSLDDSHGLDMNFVGAAGAEEQYGGGAGGGGVEGGEEDEEELVEHTASFLVYWPEREQLDLNFVLPTPASLQLPPHHRGVHTRPALSAAERKSQEAMQRRESAVSAKRKFKSPSWGLSDDVAAAAAAASMGTTMGGGAYGATAVSTANKKNKAGNAKKGKSGGADDVGLVAAAAIALSSLARPEYAHQPRVLWQPLTLHASPHSASAAASSAGATTPARRTGGGRGPTASGMPAATSSTSTTASNLNQALADAEEDDDNSSVQSEQSSGAGSSHGSEQWTPSGVNYGTGDADGRDGDSDFGDNNYNGGAQECLVGLEITWQPLHCGTGLHNTGAAGAGAAGATGAAGAGAGDAAATDEAQSEATPPTSPASGVDTGLHSRVGPAHPLSGRVPRSMSPSTHSGVLRITL
jgi:hypothetical protein